MSRAWILLVPLSSLASLAALCAAEEPPARGVLFYGKADAKASSATADKKDPPPRVKPHDLVTVRIKDIYSFRRSSQLSTDVKNDTKFNINKFFNITEGKDGRSKVLRPTALDKPAIELSSQQKQDNKGTGAQGQAIEAMVTAHVVQVYPNGTFSLESVQVTENDEEKLTMTLFGIARVDDLSADNVLAGERLDGKCFSVKTEGPVSRTGKRGWAKKILDAVWPF